MLWLDHSLNMDVSHGTRIFKSRYMTLRVCRDERHVLLKRINIASLLELSEKFWMIWNGQHSRKEGKLHDSQWCLKLSLVISYTYFHPAYDLKGDRALGNSFKLMPKQTNSNKVLLHVQSETGNLYQIVSLKSSQSRLSKRPSWAIFKNVNPGTFYYYYLCSLDIRTLIIS